MTVRSLREYHILRITDLDTLPADYPILNVITKPEVITLGIISSFLGISRSLGSKGVPEHYKPSCSHRELGSNTVYPIYSIGSYLLRTMQNLSTGHIVFLVNI